MNSVSQQTRTALLERRKAGVLCSFPVRATGLRVGCYFLRVDLTTPKAFGLSVSTLWRRRCTGRHVNHAEQNSQPGDGIPEDDLPADSHDPVASSSDCNLLALPNCPGTSTTVATESRTEGLLSTEQETMIGKISSVQHDTDKASKPGGSYFVTLQESRQRHADRGEITRAESPLRSMPGRTSPSRRSDHVSVDFKPAAASRDPFTPSAPKPRGKRWDVGVLWGLLVLALSYVHHSTTGFAIPALLPAISSDMKLTDSEGALLTAGYTFLYAIALVPIGILADRVDRPRLLAVGLVGWSILTVAASRTHSFSELMVTRVGFAIAQATQNPICFSLIPELFPEARTTAMAFYNSAIYLGRALSFAVAILAGNLVKKDLDKMVFMVPLEKLDLSHVSILYTQGDMAAIVPIYDYRINFAQPAAQAIGDEGWRHWLQWLGPPGLLIAALCVLTVDEPRAERGLLGDPLQSSKFINSTTRRFNRSAGDTFVGRDTALPLKRADSKVKKLGESIRNVRELLASRGFQSVTLAATLNDVGSWALISWHATFYARVYNLDADVYAPLLAVVVPLGGLIGGVGGGLMGDWLSRIGRRQYLTAGANVAAAPFIAMSLLLPDYRASFASLLLGFALAEAWRAPAVIIVRDVSPQGLGSTASAVHLCIRNIIGGLGPLGVAYLAEYFTLQQAMLLVPTSFLLSGLAFWSTERIMLRAAR